MPRQTRKEKAAPVRRQAPKAKVARVSSKVKPRFKPEPPPRALPEVTRMHCPFCGMMTEIDNFKEANPQLKFYKQTFGGRISAPRGTKAGQRSKKAPGFMEYREVTDPSSPEYGEAVEVFKVRISNFSEAVLGGPLTLPEPKPIIPQKRKRKKPAK